jgi:hypothetical protein
MARWKIIYKSGFTAGIFFFALNGEFPLAMFDYRGVPPKIDRMCVYVVGCDSVRVKSCVVKSGHGFIYPFIRIPIL